MTIQLVCTDRGQHRSRDIVTMVDRSRWRADGSPGRWQVVFRSSWDRPRLPPGRTGRSWQPVAALHPKYDGLQLERELAEADVWTFRCPSCARRPRWAREHLDELCDRASAEGIAAMDLSLLE